MLVLVLSVVGGFFTFPDGVFGVEGMSPLRMRRLDSMRGSQKQVAGVRRCRRTSLWSPG